MEHGVVVELVRVKLLNARDESASLGGHLRFFSYRSRRLCYLLLRRRLLLVVVSFLFVVLFLFVNLICYFFASLFLVISFPLVIVLLRLFFRSSVSLSP